MGPPELLDRLACRRAEKEELERELATLTRAAEARLPQPTADWVTSQLADLAGILAEGGPAAALALRALVGGRVIVERVERPGRKRHALRARFTVRAATLAHAVGGPPPSAGEATGDGVGDAAEEIVLDLGELAPWERLIEPAKALWDEGLLNGEIAARLGCGRNSVTKAIAAWHRRRGLPPPDGRSRWPRLADRPDGPRTTGPWRPTAIAPGPPPA